ncbi:MAG TPA: hypothetical protein VNG34_12520 [Actinomycetota bacterium]|nr:hypothetical protein [Actinomycetota bacterium]
MSGTAPASGDPEAAADRPLPGDRPLSTDLRRAGPVAARGGLLVAVAAIALGQLPHLVVNLLGGGLAVSTQVRMGWLYTAASNAVSIRIEGSGGAAGVLEPLGTATFRLVLLTVTFMLGWLLLRAGAAAARRVSDTPVRRALAGALVAPSYAVALGIVGLVVELRLTTGGGFLPEVTTLSAVPWEAFVLPFVTAVAAGTVGGLLAGGGIHARAWEAFAGGWRAFVWALGLALVGLLAFAAIRPSGLEGYVEQLRSLGPRGAAVVVGHQVLLAPNHAVLTLVPAMGACDVLIGPARSTDIVCLDRQPTGESPLDTVSNGLGDGAVPTQPLPAAAKLFVLVPLVAVALGASRGAARASSNPDAALRGVCAGVVFAGLVVIGVWASTLTITTTEATLALGAQPFVAGAYAAAWGIVVGGIAGWIWFAAKGSRPSPA